MKSRPAETGGGLGALAVAVSLALGANELVVGAIGIAAGLVPGAVTALIAVGGVRGAVRRVWRGA